MGKNPLTRNLPIEHKRTKVVKKKVTPRSCLGCKIQFFSIDWNSKCPQCLAKQAKYENGDEIVNSTWHSELIQQLKGNKKPVKEKPRERLSRSDRDNYRPDKQQDWRKKQQFSGKPEYINPFKAPRHFGRTSHENGSGDGSARQSRQSSYIPVHMRR